MIGPFLLALLGPAIAPAHARLQVDPAHPYYFVDGGRPVYLLGASDRDALFMWQTAKGFDWQTYLQTLHDHGFNYVRQDVTAWQHLDVPAEYPAQFSRPAWPFLRVGPGLASDGDLRFDLTRFDPRFFSDRLRPFLARAEELGIYVELTFFDHVNGRGWPWCLYADGNNVNALGTGPGQVDADAALDNQRLLAIQRGYVSRVLAETAPFGNVIYEVCNEGGGRRWVTDLVDYIHNHPRFPSQLVSAGEQNSSFDAMTGPNDIIVKHRGRAGLYATDADVKRHHDALLRFRAGKPIVHNEYFLYANGGTDDPNFVRKMMWGDFTAGGHSNLYDFTHWRGTGRTVADGEPSRDPPAEILNAARYLRWLVERVPFSDMAPADGCVSVNDPSTYAMALGAPQRCYVVYLLGGRASEVRLTVGEGTYRVRWYDPQAGVVHGASTSDSDGGAIVLQVPAFEHDTVLWLDVAVEK
jgi:hypothetical protein